MLEDKLMLNDDMYKTEVLLIGTPKQLAKGSGSIPVSTSQATSHAFLQRVNDM